MLTKGRALIAVGSSETRRELYKQLLDRGVFSDYAADGQVAMQRLGEIAYGLVVLDLTLTKVDALRIVETIGAMSPRPMIIAIADDAPYPTLDSDVVQIVVRAPFPLHELAGIIASCLTTPKRLKSRTEDEADRARNRL